MSDLATRSAEVAADRSAALESRISVVIPAYNEERAIGESVRQVREALKETRDHEVLVVDDGSTDRTADRAAQAGATVIRLGENLGYGAALRVGIRRARHDTIVITDGDGTYPAEAIPDLARQLRECDMVVGARVNGSAVPIARRPAKWFLARLAGYLSGRHIPDLNSGMRAMRRQLVLRFEHLLPAGFSFTTTITLAALCSGALVRYSPIEYRERIGDSKIRPTHALDFMLLIIRTIVYFNPLKVFLPLGGIFFVGGFAKFLCDLVIGNFSETALLGFLGAALLWAVGLLSDQIARIALRSEPFV